MTTEPKKQFIPPRAVRNKSALDKYLSDNGIKSLWPAVEQQLFTYAVKGLPAGAYNNSIVRFRGKLVMAYRFHEGTSLKTKLGIAELDENFTVFYSQTLNFDEEESVEDARLYVFKNELWINFVVSNWPNFPASQAKIAKLYKPNHWRVSDKDLYWLPDRQTAEKNHVPLPFDDVLHLIYRQNMPQEGNPAELAQIIYSPYEKREMKTPALRWPYGEVRGGTVPLPYKDKLISFFHSRLENFMPPTRHCYFVGAIMRKADLPFQMLAISKKPIIYGSEVGGDESRFHHKKSVIFPLGAIEHQGGWLLSAGVNDSQCALIKINEKDLNFE